MQVQPLCICLIFYSELSLSLSLHFLVSGGWVLCVGDSKISLENWDGWRRLYFESITFKHEISPDDDAAWLARPLFYAGRYYDGIFTIHYFVET